MPRGSLAGVRGDSTCAQTERTDRHLVPVQESFDARAGSVLRAARTSCNPACADAGTGKVRASAATPTDHSAVEYFGSVTYAGGHAYSYYLDDGARQSGVASLTPPAACSG